ncbi:hypothetical protein [Lentzea flaviverrucosa]|nr:hypothetical protein [Lentzea flaviverrucosa]
MKPWGLVALLDAMKKILSALPASTSADEVLGTLRATLPPPPTNPFTRAPCGAAPEHALGHARPN